MPDLREQLRDVLHRHACIVGVGNVDLGDDGFGVRLVERLGKRGTRSTERGRPGARNDGGRRGLGPLPLPEGGDPGDGTAPVGQATGGRWSLMIAGTHPEFCLGRLAHGNFDTVLFLDAIEFGAAPGSVVLLDSHEMASRLPQISTHRISLGLLAQLIETDGRTKAWLLGVQPASLTAGGELSLPVKAALDLVSRLIGGCPVPPAGMVANTPARSAFLVPHSALPC